MPRKRVIQVEGGGGRRSRWKGARGKPPTSHNDSLVAVVGCMGVERPENTTNESLGLVGSGGEWRGEWRGQKTYQLVVGTRW